MNKYKALVSDIDGTLTPLAPDALPSDNVTKTIKDAVQDGLIFVLATGRPFYLVEHLVNYLGIQGFCIVDNGAAICELQSKEIVWNASLPEEHANEILEQVQHINLFRLSSDQGVIDKPEKAPNGSIRKISVHDIKPDEAERLLELVRNSFPEVVGVKAASYEGEHLLDLYFSHKDATKQHAVHEDARLENISPEEIIGVGDGHNDIALLEASGLKVAMGNAVPELKEIADYIAPSVDEDGLADVINKYFFNKYNGD